MTPAPHDKEPDHKPTLLQVIGSVLSAATGIQNSKNRERDFKHGKANTFVIAGDVVYRNRFFSGAFCLETIRNLTAERAYRIPLSDVDA